MPCGRGCVILEEAASIGIISSEDNRNQSEQLPSAVTLPSDRVHLNQPNVPSHGKTDPP